MALRKKVDEATAARLREVQKHAAKPKPALGSSAKQVVEARIKEDASKGSALVKKAVQSEINEKEQKRKDNIWSYVALSLATADSPSAAAYYGMPENRERAERLHKEMKPEDYKEAAKIGATGAGVGAAILTSPLWAPYAPAAARFALSPAGSIIKGASYYMPALSSAVPYATAVDFAAGTVLAGNEAYKGVSGIKNGTMSTGEGLARTGLGIVGSIPGLKLFTPVAKAVGRGLRTFHNEGAAMFDRLLAPLPEVVVMNDGTVALTNPRGYNIMNVDKASRIEAARAARRAYREARNGTSTASTAAESTATPPATPAPSSTSSYTAGQLRTRSGKVLPVYKEGPVEPTIETTEYMTLPGTTTRVKILTKEPTKNGKSFWVTVEGQEGTFNVKPEDIISLEKVVNPGNPSTRVRMAADEVLDPRVPIYKNTTSTKPIKYPRTNEGELKVKDGEYVLGNLLFQNRRWLRAVAIGTPILGVGIKPTVDFVGNLGNHVVNGGWPSLETTATSEVATPIVIDTTAISRELDDGMSILRNHQHITDSLNQNK